MAFEKGFFLKYFLRIALVNNLFCLPLYSQIYRLLCVDDG